VSRRYWLGLAKDWGVSIGVVVAAFVLWGLFATPRPISDGPAPEFALSSLQGESVKLSDFGEDEVVVLNFWFTTCGPCRHEIPELTKYHEAHPEVPLLGISVDALPLRQLAGRSEKLGITYTVLHDERSQVAAAYGVRIFPTTIVVRGGEVISSRIGEVDERSLGAMVAAARAR